MLTALFLSWAAYKAWDTSLAPASALKLTRSLKIFSGIILTHREARSKTYSILWWISTLISIKSRALKSMSRYGMMSSRGLNVVFVSLSQTAAFVTIGSDNLWTVLSYGELEAWCSSPSLFLSLLFCNKSFLMIQWCNYEREWSPEYIQRTPING